jgi:hypothetical protein
VEEPSTASKADIGWSVSSAVQHRTVILGMRSSSRYLHLAIKLNLGDSDRWIYALVSLSRAAFEFLTLAVRGSPIPRIKTLNLEGASVSASGSFTDMATRQRDGRFIPKSGQRVRPRSKD